MSRFMILGDYSYTVDEEKINVFNISTPANTNFVRVVFAAPEEKPFLETIFADNGYLYLGSQTGMFVFSLRRDPGHPFLVS